MDQLPQDPIRNTTNLLIGALAILLLAEIALSLRWQLLHDAPILYYVGLLIDKYGFVPYRDIFETSFPGTLLIFYGLYKTLGYSDLAFRLTDIALLLILLAATVRLMRPFGIQHGYAAAILFGLLYIGCGPTMSMQREYLALIPVSLALILVTTDRATSSALRVMTIGGCFGITASIKPQLAIGILPIVPYLAYLETLHSPSAKKYIVACLKIGLYCLGGLMTTLCIPFIWVWYKGGLPAFWEMFNEYLPLYLQLTGERESLDAADRIKHIAKQWRMSHAGFWLIAILGCYIAIDKYPRDKKKLAFAILMLSEFLLASLHPVIAGQFWTYHWLHFFWYSLLCASFILIVLFDHNAPTAKRLFTGAAFVIFMALTFRPLAYDFFLMIKNRPLPPIKEGRVEAAVNFLKPRLQPGETIQSFDSAGGGIHSLLLLEAKLASRYICDVYFYHHTNNAYIQKIRKEFIDQLSHSKPMYILDSTAKVKVYDPNSSDEFPELEALMASDYQPVMTSKGVTIYARKEKGSE